MRSQSEYTATTQNIRRLVTVSGTPTPIENELTNTAWAVTGSWFLTGDKNSYRGIKIKKANTFPTFESIGAVELLGRASGIQIDDKAFAALGANLSQTYADPAKQASEALQLGVAVKWYLNNSVNIFVAYEQTKFTGGTGATANGANAAIVADRDTEKAVTTAFNVSF